MSASSLIPGQPDPATQPALSSAWKRIFNASLAWVEPDLVDLVPFYKRKHHHKLAVAPPPEIQDFLNATSSRYENSKGWAGASIVPDAGSRFVQIYGGWQVPTAQIPKGEDSKKKYYSATWIGFDGDRRYVDATLPQVGTQQNTPGPNYPPPDELPDYYAWFQWWAPRRTKAELWWVRGIPITPGDDVMGLVWAIDPKIVAIVFCNFATNKITWFAKEAPIYQHRRHDLSLTYQPDISGATAEWIVEDPTKDIEAKENPEQLPFTDYGKVAFCNCVAGMAQAPGDATSEKVLTAPRYKRLYKVLPDPPRTRFFSMPERGTDATELTVKYGGF